MRAFVFTVVILGLCVGTVWYGARERPVSPEQSSGNGLSVDSIPSGEHLKRTQAENAARDEGEAKVMALEMSATATAVAEAMVELERWEKEVVPLLRNEEGRALTKRSTWVESFAVVYNTERPSRSELEAAGEKAKTFLEQSRASAVPFLLTGHDRSELTSARAKAEEAARSYRSGREAIEALLNQARSSPLVPSGSLGEVLEQRSTQR